MKPITKIVLVARLCPLIAIAFALGRLLNDFITVEPRIKDSMAKRVFAWILFFVLIFAGSSLLTEGHVFYVKAKVRESEKTEILKKHGYYENPYWVWRSLCDICGMACFGVLGLWLYAAFLHKTAELVSRRSVGVKTDERSIG